MTKLKIIKRGNGYKIQARKSLIRTIMLAPREFDHNPLNPNEQCVFTLAKIYYRGGGWWWLSGYAYDRSDTDRVVKVLRVLSGDVFFGLDADTLRAYENYILNLPLPPAR